MIAKTSLVLSTCRVHWCICTPVQLFHSQDLHFPAWTLLLELRHLGATQDSPGPPGSTTSATVRLGSIIYHPQNRGSVQHHWIIDLTCFGEGSVLKNGTDTTFHSPEHFTQLLRTPECVWGIPLPEESFIHPDPGLSFWSPADPEADVRFCKKVSQLPAESRWKPAVESCTNSYTFFFFLTCKSFQQIFPRFPIKSCEL